MCKREQRKGKGVFLFSFFGIWIDKEVSNYTSTFPYFRQLSCNQTRPREIGTHIQTKIGDISILENYQKTELFSNEYETLQILTTLPLQ